MDQLKKKQYQSITQIIIKEYLGKDRKMKINFINV